MKTLRDAIQLMSLEPSRESMGVLSDVALQLVDQVEELRSLVRDLQARVRRLEHHSNQDMP